MRDNQSRSLCIFSFCASTNFTLQEAWNQRLRTRFTPPEKHTTAIRLLERPRYRKRGPIMPSQPPLPPLLAPYLSTQPESSLTLVSSILGATSNWLVLRFLHAALSTSSNPNASIGLEDLPDGKKRKVVLVSFLRGWEFWKSESKRLVSQFPESSLFTVHGHTGCCG